MKISVVLDKDSWLAKADTDSGSPMYDAVGHTVESALYRLCEELAKALEEER